MTSSEPVGAAALIVASVFATAAVAKARHSATFREQIADYQLIPYGATGVVAGVIVAVEAGSSGLIVIPATRQVGGAIALILLLAFLSALLWTWSRGREIVCACFGGSGEVDRVGLHSTVRTGLLALLAALALVTPSASGSLHAASFVLAALGGVLVFLISELVRLFSEMRRYTPAVVGAQTPSSTAKESVS